MKNPSSNFPPEDTRVSPSRRNWPCDSVLCPWQGKNRDRDTKRRRKKKSWKLDGLFGEEKQQGIALPPLPSGGGICRRSEEKEEVRGVYKVKK